MDPIKNFAIVEVSTGYNAAATSIVLSSNEGASLPSPSSDGDFNLVWWNSTDYTNPADDPNVEIVRVTARSTDTLTVTRAQEDTSATTKNTAAKTYKMALAVTKKTVTDERDAFFELKKRYECARMPDGTGLPLPTLFVRVDAPTNGSGTEASPYNDIQTAITAAAAGDHIYIYADQPTTFTSSWEVPTSKTFEYGAPLVITISHNVTITQDAGSTGDATIATSHVWINNHGIFDGITSGDGTDAGDYDDNLLIITADNANSGGTFNGYIENIRVEGGVWRNSGREAIRVKYLEDAVIGYFRIYNTGMARDAVGLTNSVTTDNGEGIYVGTSPSQLTDSNVDRSNNIRIKHINATDCLSSEIVNTKEGTYHIVIDDITASDTRYANGAGINLQGESSVVRHCQLYDIDGAGIRMGESTAHVDVPNAGQNHVIIGNRLDTVTGDAIKDPSGGTAILVIGNETINITGGGGIDGKRDGEAKDATWLIGSFDSGNNEADISVRYLDDTNTIQTANSV